ncbi:NEDD8-specific protease 2 [Spathaspora sp. JA1]|nr:NEDD8-specific protease 2 [Spathaspora sp. JA1]
MSIIYDDNKGFCINTTISTDSIPHNDNLISNGFDQLPWDEYLPEEPQEEPQEESESTPREIPNKRKLTKSEKKTLRQTKKINAARKRQIQRQQDINNTIATIPQFNPYLVKSEIKSIFSKLTKSTKSDFKLFQYHSIALYKSDLEHILPGEWLNDNNISLIYELIQQLFIKSGHKQFSYQVQLLYPSLVQLFLHFPMNEDLENILPIKELTNSKFIFIPINFIDDFNSIDLEEENIGDHWALTLFSILGNKLYVYDSMMTTEDQDTTQLLSQLCKRLQSCKNIVSSTKPIEIIHMKCDQQDNFDDCGIQLI